MFLEEKKNFFYIRALAHTEARKKQYPREQNRTYIDYYTFMNMH